MNKKGSVDIYILLAALGLMIFSIGAVYSASIGIAHAQHGTGTYLIVNHIMRVGISIVALFIGIKIDYHIYEKISKWLILIAIVMLAYTLVNGATIKGAQRWISVGFIQFQPSEFAKYALIIHIAVLLTEKSEYIADLKFGYLPILFWIVATYLR